MLSEVRSQKNKPASFLKVSLIAVINGCFEGIEQIAVWVCAQWRNAAASDGSYIFNTVDAVNELTCQTI